MEKYYFRLQLFHGDDTMVSEIKSTAGQFKLSKERFLEEAYSDATSPVHIGTLTGSVTSMAKSKDFHKVFKHKFKLSILGLYFPIHRTKDAGEWRKNISTVHIEIDCADLHKRKYMEERFNRSSRSLDNTFFGVPMYLTLVFNYNTEDEIHHS